MSTLKARKAMKDNLERHVSPTRAPATYNISVALLSIAQALDALEAKVEQLSEQVERLARQPLRKP